MNTIAPIIVTVLLGAAWIMIFATGITMLIKEWRETPAYIRACVIAVLIAFSALPVMAADMFIHTYTRNSTK